MFERLLNFEWNFWFDFIPGVCWVQVQEQMQMTILLIITCADIGRGSIGIGGCWLYITWALFFIIGVRDHIACDS